MPLRVAAQEPRCTLGVDVNVSGLDLNESEVSIDVNPTNPDNLVIIGHVEGFETMNTFYTLDGGQTWTLVALGDAEDGVTSTFRFDPTLVFDEFGNVYVGYAARNFDGATRRETLVVCKSTDGGQSYPQCAEVHTQDSIGTLPGNDKWHMATGPDPITPGQDNVYIVWTLNELETAGDPPETYVDQRIVASTSTDGGLTWSAPVTIADDAIAGEDHSLFADPAVGPNGELYVSWYDFLEAAVNVDVSLDGGATFGTDVLVTDVQFDGLFDPIPAQWDRQITPGPTLDSDRSGGAHHGRLYLAYTDYDAGNLPDTDVYVRYSDDGGATWSARVRVNDDTGVNSQFLPWLDVDQTTGTVHMIWYDARNDINNQQVEAFVAASDDGGATFTINAPLSDAASDQSLGNPNRWAGNNFLEYIGIAGLDCAAVAVWADNSADPGNLDYYADRFVPSFCGSPPTAGNADQTVECTVPGATEVVLNAAASSDPDGDLISFEWYDGAVLLGTGITFPTTFPLGTQNLTLRVIDARELLDCTPVSIQVVDTTPPILTPVDVVAECAGPGGTAVTLDPPTIDDACDSNVLVSNDAPGLYPLGTTTVQWTGTDDSGNSATVPQLVTIVDTAPPTLTAPADITAECQGPGGTTVTLGTPTVDDLCDPGAVTVAHDAPAVFPSGTTIVTWTATDGAGNMTSATQSVTILDTIPPTLTPPGPITAECQGPAGTAVDLGTPIVDDLCDPAAVTVGHDAPATFPLGTTTVTWTATDGAGNVTSATQDVTVVDTTPPALTVAVSPAMLWPPNHKLVEIVPTIDASDVCDASPTVELLNITMDEGEETITYDPAYDETLGDGHTTDDIQVIEGRIFLRAERSGLGDGRVYTITYSATDASGNVTIVSATVTVPHNQ